MFDFSIILFYREIVYFMARLESGLCKIENMYVKCTRLVEYCLWSKTLRSLSIYL